MGSVFQPALGTTPAVSIFDNFKSGAGTVRLNVWADDSADVLLDGKYLAQAWFTQSVCSGQAIGCRPQDAGQLSTQVASGDHTLQFNVYQVGAGGNTTVNPFGLLFTGTAPAPDLTLNRDPSSTTPTPEPATAGLLGGGLLILGFVRLRRFTTQAAAAKQ